MTVVRAEHGPAGATTITDGLHVQGNFESIVDNLNMVASHFFRTSDLFTSEGKIRTLFLSTG